MEIRGKGRKKNYELAQIQDGNIEEYNKDLYKPRSSKSMGSKSTNDDKEGENSSEKPVYIEKKKFYNTVLMCTSWLKIFCLSLAIVFQH